MNQELGARHPGQPWSWREDWARGKIEDENCNAGWALLGFAVFWNAIAGGMTYAIWKGTGPRGPEHYFILLFPLIGTLVLVAGVYGLLRRRRYGVPVLELATLPAPLGRALAGHVRVPRGLEPDRQMTIWLRSIRRTVTGTGKNRQTSETTLWEDRRSIPGSIRAGDGVTIPIAIPIPADAVATDGGNPFDRVLWRLVVRSEVPGVDFEAQFEVPVFRTEESASPLTPEERARFG
jgi:hypothetical protein